VKTRIAGIRTLPWIVWYAVLLHTLWACLLLTSKNPYGATALHIYSPIPRPLIIGALLTASVLAAWAVTRRQPSWQTLAALLPQQAILTVSAYAALAAVAAAHYGDGVIRPREFILADQAPVILVFALHTAAVVEMHARRTTAEVLQATLTRMNTEAEQLRPPGPSSSRDPSLSPRPGQEPGTVTSRPAPVLPPPFQ
jgi:hypothetical protein